MIPYSQDVTDYRHVVLEIERAEKFRQRYIESKQAIKARDIMQRIKRERKNKKQQSDE